MQKSGGDVRVRLLTAAELDEHRQAIGLAKQGLRSALDRLRSTGPDAPEVPKPAR
jgi:hypothetical protein